MGVCVWSSVFIAIICQVTAQAPHNATLGANTYIIPHAEANWIGAVRYCKAMGGNLASLDSQEEHNFVVSLIKSSTLVRTLLLRTHDDYIYHYLEDSGLSVLGHTSVTFEVQACHDAHLALSTTKDSGRDTYEVVIGGWSDSQSVIRDCKQCAHMDEVRQQDHPLDCNASRPFWLSWQDGLIRLGQGTTVGEQQMMSWQDPDPHPVNHLAVATGFGSSGVWNIPISTYRPGVFWLGATDLQVEGEWVSLPFLEEIEYSHWSPGQPSGGHARHCAAMDGARDLDWIDADCEIRRNFVCEIPI